MYLARRLPLILHAYADPTRGDRHITPKNPSQPPDRPPTSYITAHRERGSSQRLPEKLIWSFAVQLVAAVRAVHASGAACRSMLHPSYVLVTTGARLRLGCVRPVSSRCLNEQQGTCMIYGLTLT